jgi:hypothetical protein
MTADKPPFRIIRKWREGGVPHVEYEAASWFGPVEAGGVGYYEKRRAVVSADNVRNTVSPSVSYWGDLQKALA